MYVIKDGKNKCKTCKEMYNNYLNQKTFWDAAKIAENCKECVDEIARIKNMHYNNNLTKEWYETKNEFNKRVGEMTLF